MNRQLLIIFLLVSTCCAIATSEIFKYSYPDGSKQDDWSEAIISYINQDHITKVKIDFVENNKAIAYTVMPFVTGEITIGSSMSEYMTSYEKFSGRKWTGKESQVKGSGINYSSEISKSGSTTVQIICQYVSRVVSYPSYVLFNPQDVLETLWKGLNDFKFRVMERGWAVKQCNGFIYTDESGDIQWYVLISPKTFNIDCDTVSSIYDYDYREVAQECIADAEQTPSIMSTCCRAASVDHTWYVDIKIVKKEGASPDMWGVHCGGTVTYELKLI
ncbi:hypothetical protein CAAN3_10S04060 [[Candida] anglica]